MTIVMYVYYRITFRLKVECRFEENMRTFVRQDLERQAQGVVAIFERR
jgi:hypothetical protein